MYYCGSQQRVASLILVAVVILHFGAKRLITRPAYALPIAELHLGQPVVPANGDIGEQIVIITALSCLQFPK